MTDNELAETASIELLYDNEYRKRVIEEDYPDSWISIGIEIGGVYLWDMEYSVTGFACGIVLQLLDSIDAIHSDKRHIIELEYGPSWIVVEPSNEHSVNVVKCYTYGGARNPEKRLDIDPSLSVTKLGWCEAVIETAHDFRQTVLDLNPDLHNNTAIEEIERETKRAEAIVAVEFDARQDSDS